MSKLQPVFSLMALVCLLNNLSLGQSFELIKTDLGSHYRGDVQWGDYDNDGDLDILVNGCCDPAEVYRNDNGEFNKLNLQIDRIEQGVCQWIDYDIDGDLDIFINGQSICSIYKNTGNDRS